MKNHFQLWHAQKLQYCLAWQDSSATGELSLLVLSGKYINFPVVVTYRGPGQASEMLSHRFKVNLKIRSYTFLVMRIPRKCSYDNDMHVWLTLIDIYLPNTHFANLLILFFSSLRSVLSRPFRSGHGLPDQQSCVLQHRSQLPLSRRIRHQEDQITPRI
jgi:hypothetical protein